MQELKGKSSEQQEQGEALARELGDAAVFQCTDVTREDDIAAAIGACQDAFGLRSVQSS